MKKYSSFLIVLFTFIFFILIILNKTLVSKTIIFSFYIWFNTLVPSMFPMFIISDILINYEFTKYIPKRILNIIANIFNISDNGTLVFLLSLFTGFPTNAYIIKESFNKRLLSKEECEHLLYFCHFSNPLFVLNTIGIFYLKNNIYGIIILVSHILSGILVGIIFRNNNTFKNNYTKPNYKSQSFGIVLSNSIKKSISTLLTISGTICLFLILSSLICNIFNLNIYLEIFVKSMLEMTMGLYTLSTTNISDTLKIIISTSILSFGGLSIHMQVLTCLGEEIRYRNYFIGRIYQVVIAIIISFIITKLFFL